MSKFSPHSPHVNEAMACTSATPSKVGHLFGCGE